MRWDGICTVGRLSCRTRGHFGRGALLRLLGERGGADSFTVSVQGNRSCTLFDLLFDLETFRQLFHLSGPALRREETTTDDTEEEDEAFGGERRGPATTGVPAPPFPKVPLSDLHPNGLLQAVGGPFPPSRRTRSQCPLLGLV